MIMIPRPAFFAACAVSFLKICILTLSEVENSLAIVSMET